jgi:hypothetical protein
MKNSLRTRSVEISLLIRRFSTSGALIVRLQPFNAIGWLLQGVGWIWLVALAADNHARAAVTLDGRLCRRTEAP